MKPSARNLISAILWAFCTIVYAILTISQITKGAEWYLIALDAFIAAVSLFNSVMAVLRHIREKRENATPTEKK